MSDRRILLRDINDDELVLKCLEAYLCIWGEALDRAHHPDEEVHSKLNVQHIATEIRGVIRDLADRKKRLRNLEYGLGD